LIKYLLSTLPPAIVSMAGIRQSSRWQVSRPWKQHMLTRRGKGAIWILSQFLPAGRYAALACATVMTVSFFENRAARDDVSSY